jgi:RNA polymerase primary sigma factor
MKHRHTGNRDYTWEDIRFGDNDASWEWESQLRPQLQNVELLGEIPITAEECDQLGQAIGRIVKSWGQGRGLRALTESRPAAFAVYLVAQGLHGYQGGDYWTEVVKRSGFDRARTWMVGQAFEKVLEAFQLPLFYDMRTEKAHRYVSLILAHGGIPTYCLDDFFGNMLQPAVRRAEYADMTAAELIDEWQWRARAQYFTDKPVLRFLTYGGRVAEDFLDRCREMAHTYVETGDVPPPEELGLPERVVSAYVEWATAQGKEQIEREERDQWRLRRPDIRVDPWGEGITFDLPPQQVPATFIQAEISWRIVVGAQTTSVPVRVRRSGFDWATVPESVRLGAPAETYQAALLVDGVAKRTWRFQGVAPDRPLFVFDAERLTALAWKHSLPAQFLGFLYPQDCVLTIDGSESPSTRHLEQLRHLPGGWSDFQGQIWEVSEGDRVRLSRDGQKILSAPVRADEVARRPRLTGGDLISEDAAGRRAPVYAGEPPSIRIPLTKRGSLAEELGRWRLSLTNNWAAAPEPNVKTTLDSLQAHLERGEDEVELPLSLPNLLGQHPVGTYQYLRQKQ